jgi:hypothetical protein
MSKNVIHRFSLLFLDICFYYLFTEAQMQLNYFKAFSAFMWEDDL